MRVPLTIRDFIDRAETVYADRPAVIDEPDQPAPPVEALTWSGAAERARAQAAGLDALGVGFGERVAIVSHNSSRLLTSFFGVSGHGRVLVPINFRLNAEEVGYIVEHSGASVLLVDPELDADLADVRAPHRFVIGADTDAALLRPGVEPVPWTPDEDATATINYTSGTTARPKGVQLTHRSLWLNATVFGWQTGVSDRDTYLWTLPMFHCNGWGMTYAVTGMGGTHIVLRKVDGAEILRRVERHGVTLLCGAPAVVAAILDAAAEWDGPIPGRDRVRMVVAGAPPPTRLIERMETELGWEFIQIYGLTETSPLLTMTRGRAEWDGHTPADRARELGRAGAPALGVSLRIDEHGEVLARSNVVLEGYWDNPTATDEALAGGWFHTGDGGTIDDAGYLSISDRKKDVIISGGENVSSIEVEDAVFSHPDVAEVAVIGIPDEKWGELVLA
ncbi:MAG: AMP-binding protein, partial [Actinomycetota bacterium]